MSNPTLRLYSKYTFQTLLIVSALLLAMVTALFLKGWMAYQQSYDSHYPKDIYRATITYQAENGLEEQWARVNVDWVNELPKAFPEIDELIRFQSFRPRNVTVGRQKYKEINAYSVDPQVFKVFNLKLIQGGKQALNTPNSVVLTASTAKKYFGSVSAAMDQNIKLDSPPNQAEYTVRGVISDPPTNTHLPITLLSSINRAEDRSGWAYIYLKMKSTDDSKSLSSNLEAFVSSNHHNEDVGIKLDIQPIQDIYLNSDASREIVTPGQPEVIRIFGWVLALLVVIGTANFVLSKSTMTLNRWKVLSLRKVLGASSVRLKLDLLLEAGVMLVLSFVLALGLVYLLLPSAEAFFETSFQLNLMDVFQLAAWFVLSSLTGLGVYLILFKGIQSKLKSVENFSRNRFGLREVLLTLQFALTFGILISFLFVNHQLDYMLSGSKGLNTNQVLAITNFHTEVSNELERYQDDIKRIAGVEESAGLMELPSRAIKDQGNVSLKGDFTGNAKPLMDIQVIDESFFEVLEIPFVAGRKFPDDAKRQVADDGEGSVIDQINLKKRSYIINESAAKVLGFAQANDAISQQISWSNQGLELQPGKIVGVVADYHQEGFNQTIDPTVYIHEPIMYRNLIVKIMSESPRSVLQQLEAHWNDRFSELPFEYAFLDDQYERLYQKEQLARRLFSVFTTVAILILITGLIGLLVFELQRRLKDLAVRKVLGAYFWNLLVWITKPYWYMIAGAFAVMAPICFVLLQDWIATYAYRAEPSLSLWIIPMVAVGTVFVTICALIVRKYSTINPVEILRSE